MSNTNDQQPATYGLRFSLENRVAHIELDRAGAGNRFTVGMLADMARLMNAAASKAEILLITAIGDDFCLGRERSEQDAALPPFDAYRPIVDFYRALSDFPGVSVAAVQGKARGFGVGMTIRSDIAIASADATFALDEVPKGIPPFFVASELVDHLSPKQLSDLVFTGRTVDAVEALLLGIVSRTATNEELRSSALQLVEQLRQVDVGLLGTCKQYLKTIRTAPKQARLSIALSEQTLYAVNKK